MVCMESEKDKKKYDKLVRDNIPAIIKGNGGSPIFHVSDSDEYWLKLKEKLLEEVSEFKEDESIEEFADILEVLDAIANYKKFDSKEVKSVKAKKSAERGKFEKRIVLDQV
jgi:predicted house-cleaning noncanonical NTP pyrophosphatase (MazG superfamily)